MVHTASVNHDDRVRWQGVISQFRHHIEPIKCASDVQVVHQRVISLAQQLLREVVADWNHLTVTHRLPTEIMANCFSFLSMRSLLVATHVSRGWRATALSCPSLWRSVVFSHSTDPELVELVLERSGQTLLDFTFVADISNEALLDSLLTAHMHRMRRLTWISQKFSFLRRPAPFLESLACEMVCLVPEDLLGGCPGRLRSLNLGSLRLPARCPALSTLTSLIIGLEGDDEEAASLAHLFPVCPLLEHLSISGLAQAHFRFLLSGTSTQLRKLDLSSTSSSPADLTRYVSAWAPSNPSLSTIKLSMTHRYTPTHSASVLEDAQTLSVSQVATHGLVETTNTGGRTCTIFLRHSWDFDYEVISNKIASVICPHVELLRQLRTLRAPVTILSQLFQTPPDMPALRTLAVVVQAWDPPSDTPWDSETVVPIGQLACLAQTGHLHLTCIDIVALVERGMMFDVSDIKNLAATLQTSLPARDQHEGVDVVIRGVWYELRSDQLPRVQGYRIVQSPREECTRR